MTARRAGIRAGEIIFKNRRGGGCARYGLRYCMDMNSATMIVTGKSTFRIFSRAGEFLRSAPAAAILDAMYIERAMRCEDMGATITAEEIKSFGLSGGGVYNFLTWAVGPTATRAVER